MAMYARNILYQDIAARFAVKKAFDLEKLFFYLLSNCSSLYTYNSLSKLVGLNDKTVKEYIAYFADAYLMFQVDAFSFSVKQQIKSPKKVYAIDTGMVGSVSFAFSENIGRLLENLVFLELKRQGRKLFYYKTGKGFEVDFIWMDGRKIGGMIQVAKELTHGKTKDRELRALLSALEETGLDKGTIVTYEDEGLIEEDGKSITIVPAYKFLLGR